MSMKHRIEYSVSHSVSLFGRVLVIGSVLGLAAACAHRDAARTDSAVASADSTPAVAPVSTPAPAVESVATGETVPPSATAATPAASSSNAPAAAPAAKPAATPEHHTKPHVDTATKTSAASSSSSAATPVTQAAAVQTASTATKSDTGNTSAKADTGGSQDHLLVTPQVYEGWKMFAVYCYRCHGVDAMGGGIAPNLRHSVSSEGSVTHDVFVTTVTNGRVEKGMPTWKALLSPEQIEDLWQYVTARSSGKLAPGRPHMAGGNNP